MTNTTENTGFIVGVAMPSRQRSLTVVSGTAMRGRADATAWIGKFTTTGIDCVSRGSGRLGSRVEQEKLTVIATGTGNGSGVPANPEFELALETGNQLADHAEATPRRYGAPGECPRRIPA